MIGHYSCSLSEALQLLPQSARPRSADLADREASSPARGGAGQSRSSPSLRAPRAAPSSKLTSARFSSTITRRAFHGWCPKPSFSNCCNWSSRVMLRERPTPTSLQFESISGSPITLRNLERIICKTVFLGTQPFWFELSPHSRTWRVRKRDRSESLRWVQRYALQSAPASFGVLGFTFVANNRSDHVLRMRPSEYDLPSRQRETQESDRLQTGKEHTQWRDQKSRSGRRKWTGNISPTIRRPARNNRLGRHS
jgi:hypothetical protein